MIFLYFLDRRTQDQQKSKVIQVRNMTKEQRSCREELVGGGERNKATHWGKSIVCRKVNLSFCGFVPTHLYPDHLQTCTQTCIYTGPVWSWEHADHLKPYLKKKKIDYWWTGWVTDFVPPRDERVLGFTLRFYEKSKMNESNISPKHDNSEFIFSPSWQWKHGQRLWIYRSLSGDS